MIPYPALPPVPTSPMSTAHRIQLAKAVNAVKAVLYRNDAMDHLLKAYALVWLHTALERRLDPRRCVSPKSYGYPLVLPEWQQSVRKLGIHDLVEAAWWAPQVAPQASALWQLAKERQTQAHTPLLQA